MLDRIRAQTQNYTQQIEALKREHIRNLNTISTAAIDILTEHIKLLEKANTKLEAELKFYREWEESREVVELVEQINTLREINKRLGNELASARGAVKENEPATDDSPSIILVS